MKLLFSLLVSVVFARWIYAETALMFPRAVPALDYLLDEVQIPTHDQWSKDSTDKLLSGATQIMGTVLEATGMGESNEHRGARNAAPKRREAAGGFFELDKSAS